MSTELSRERMLDAFEAQVGLVRFALEDGADLAAPVEACPGWAVHDLVAHLGTANWWGGANVREASPDTRARGMRGVLESAPAASEGSEALATWYADRAGSALETFTETDPAAPAWTFEGPGRADYWLRRQLHETVIHRWDLERALSGESGTTPLMDDVAVDTIDEFCTALYPVMALAKPPLEVTIRVRAGENEWVLPGTTGDPGEAGSGAAPEVEVTGSPETLALLLWGRIGIEAEGLEITGDRDALGAALEAGLSI